jgi:predicted nucleotide-binding protein
MRKLRRPKAFIGSSTEALGIAYALQENLESDAEITVWTQGIFEPSKYPLESLLAELDSCDLGIFVFSPDDIATIRGAEASIVRDNVVFELGLFIGPLADTEAFFSHQKVPISTSRRIYLALQLSSMETRRI